MFGSPGVVMPSGTLTERITEVTSATAWLAKLPSGTAEMKFGSVLPGTTPIKKEARAKRSGAELVPGRNFSPPMRFQ